MGYVVDYLVPNLKHLADDESIRSDTLKSVMWYSSTDQAYIQRNSKFDSSALASHTTDIYVALYLSNVLNVPQITIFSRVADCHSSVDKMTAEDLLEPCLYIAADKKSLFLNIYEKMRNALAHGAINRKGKITYLLNQYKPKMEAEVSFLLQSDVDINTVVARMQRDFSLFLSNPIAFKYNCLRYVLDLEEDDMGYKSIREKRRIVIDDDFRFMTKRHVEELRVLMEKYSGLKPVDIIISENIGNISDKNLQSPDNDIRVVPQGRLKEYYSLAEVKYIE